MEFAKIIAVGIVASFASLLVKSAKPEIALLISLSGAVICLIMTVNLVADFVNSFATIFAKTGITSGILSPLFKIVGIGYLCEFSANICADTGNASISDKILLAGKVIILFVSLPIINTVIETILGILQ